MENVSQKEMRGLSHKLTVHNSCKIYFNKTSLLCKKTPYIDVT